MSKLSPIKLTSSIIVADWLTNNGSGAGFDVQYDNKETVPGGVTAGITYV